jgi:hypothetical protein
MRPSDVFELARESAIRIHEIDDELETLRSRVGGQGTGFGTSISHSTVLDPTRSLDDLMEREPVLEAERAECSGDVEDAWVLITGLEAGGKRDYADMLARFYVYAHDEEKVATDTVMVMAAMRGDDVPLERAVRMCGAMRRGALRYCDRVGIAKLRGDALCHSR